MTGRHQFIVRVACAALTLAIFLPHTAGAQVECRLAPRQQAYAFTSDTVVWRMTIRAGGKCVRGIRYNDAIINNIQLVKEPQSGQIALNSNAFTYQAPDLPGSDNFSLLISGKRLSITGNSTIRVLVSVE